MSKICKKLLICVLVISMLVPTTIAFMNNSETVKASQGLSVITKSAITQEQVGTIPKYIFMFIGDGMSYPQIQATSYYLGATASKGKIKTIPLSFMDFPVVGSAQTYDSTSFCPDSASTATSIATGYKTYSGTINMDTTMKIEYETIAEKLKKQLGYKIGIISSVNINHATPAAFYAHQASRNNYYEIGLEMIESGFDYFAGGALKNPTGSKKDQKDLYQLAQEAGYDVIKTQRSAEKLTPMDGKAIVIAGTLADSDSMSYDIDAKSGEWRLADYVEKGIEVLDGDQGFFMMVEGGKIDWACHANDAASTIQDTIALSNAVDVAIDFYNKHPQDTLILVTGDHETGGLTIGFAGTDYNTYLTNISNQDISYAKYGSEFVSKYKTNKTKFSTVLKDIEKYFGLVAEQNATSSTPSTLILSNYEYSRLLDAYTLTMKDDKTRNEVEYVLYGSYEPLTVTITHILNNKSGIDFGSYAHTGIPVPVFAVGNGANLFEGYYDNTDINDNLAKLTLVK